MCDYASRVPISYRADNPEDDELARLLQEELDSRRKINIVIK